MVPQDGSKAKLLELLNNNQFLSPSFVSWYYQILIDKAEDLCIPLEKFVQDLTLLNHPHELIKGIGADKSDSKISQKISGQGSLKHDKNIIETSSSYLLSTLRMLCCKEFKDIFHELPPVSTGSLFLDKGTSPKLLFLNFGIAYVVVDISSKVDYYNNYKTIKHLVDKCYFGGRDIDVIDNVALIKNGDNQYFISEFKGLDYESEIIEHTNSSLTSELLEIAKGLESYFESHDYFFRDLAPRNLIHGKDGKTYLIDFENLCHIDRDNLLECLTNVLPRKVWFSDILDDQDIEKIIGNIDITDKDRILINPDSFDYQFYNKQVISLEEREDIYKIVGCWERKDRYQGIKVYGHLLGRFISDFWAEESEASLLKFIQTNPTQLTKLRAVLYLLSQLDQELLLRKKYGLNMDCNLISETYFTQVLFSKKVIEPRLLYRIMKNEEGFNRKYLLVNKLLF